MSAPATRYIQHKQCTVVLDVKGFWISTFFYIMKRKPFCSKVANADQRSMEIKICRYICIYGKV